MFVNFLCAEICTNCWHVSISKGSHSGCRFPGCPSIRSKALSSESSPVAVREHRSLASTIEDRTHWRTRVHHIPVKPTSFHQPSIRPHHYDHDSSMRTSRLYRRRERPINSLDLVATATDQGHPRAALDLNDLRIRGVGAQHPVESYRQLSCRRHLGHAFRPCDGSAR